jgi:hypothetical protein
MENRRFRYQRTLVFLSLFVMIGCAPMTPYVLRNYEVGKTQEVSVGSAMLEWEYGQEDKFRGYKAGIRKQLLYNGIAGNVVNVSYREFDVDPGDRRRKAGTFIRPAFNRELQYDISKSKIIAFQEYRLEIQNADQEKIDFKVLKEPSF